VRSNTFSTNTGGYKTDNASISTWWNQQCEQCVKVRSNDARVASAESIISRQLPTTTGAETVNRSVAVPFLTVALACLTGCASQPPGVQPGGSVEVGGALTDRCAKAIARKLSVSPRDVVVKRSTISEGTGNYYVHAEVPRARADWVCEADRNGRIVEVYFSGEG
jgi:hypothetical protein